MKKKERPTGLDLSVMRPLLEGLLKNMEGGIFTIDLDKRIISFNKAAEWITGYCLEEVLGKPCSEIFKGDICDSRCPFEKIIKKGVPVNISEVVIEGKDGGQIVTSRTAFPLRDVHGNARGITTIFRDKTELKNLKQQLLQSEKLAIMGQLAAGVAHEINNPINGIINYIHLLLKKLEENNVDPETWKKNLKLVERETIRIGRLVKNLLNFSRKTEPDLRPILLKQLIEESLLILKDQFLIKNINIKKKYNNNIPEILGDFNQLQQVVLNLILNAIQAVDKQGMIKIILSTEGTKGSECFVNLGISDNGVGIPNEDLDKLFDPFYTTKTGDKGGIGLGLSIAKQIIRAHHGRISIRSQVGEGTNVSIRLPTL
ncbi:PAS domain S-box protein [candidate division WOR-3 bacterium]|jgi:two-component system NtrC family sensor kinase|nr:PAS domain S-box protein [candidate division WOR-3 bacterium]